MALAHFSKLGPAPFTVADMIGPDDAIYGGSDPFEGVEGAHDRCECCGKKLSWRVLLVDGAGKPHVVGRSCAAQAEDLKGVSLRDAELKAKRRVLDTWMTSEHGAAFREWASKVPHPKGWSGRSLLDDLRYWTRRKGADALPKIRKALKAFGAGDAAELLEEERKAEAHREAKKRRKAAYDIRYRLRSKLEEEKRTDPWEVHEWFKARHLNDLDADPAFLAKYNAQEEAKLRKLYGEPKDWDARFAALEAMTDDELWTAAEKAGWVYRGRLNGC